MMRHALARRLLGCAMFLGTLAAPLLATPQPSGDSPVMRQIQELGWLDADASDPAAQAQLRSDLTALRAAR